MSKTSLNPLINPLFGVVILCFTASAPGQERPDALGLEDIRESMIAFVNLSSAPGLDGATLNVDKSNREIDLVRGSLGYSGSITLKQSIADAYWGVAVAYADARDSARIPVGEGGAVRLEGDRSVVSLRGSGGLDLPITQHFRIRPYATVAVSQVETDTQISPLGEVLALPIVTLDNTVEALTSSATVAALYDRWQGPERIELSAQYTAAYTDTFNSRDALLDTWGWNETAILRAAYSWDSRYRSRGKPWRWKIYSNHTRFIGLDEQALGFSYYTEIGLGLDHEWNVRPLDWFGLRFIGLKLGLIQGDDVRGFSAGLSF